MRVVELGLNNPIVASAYANDVSVLVRDRQDIQALESSLQAYEIASSDRVNWGKSEAMLCGAWRQGRVPQLPGELQ